MSCVVSVSDFTVSLFQELLLNSALCYGGADLLQWTFAARAVFNNLWEHSKLELDSDTELFLADTDINIYNVLKHLMTMYPPTYIFQHLVYKELWSSNDPNIINKTFWWTT